MADKNCSHDSFHAIKVIEENDKTIIIYQCTNPECEAQWPVVEE